jgi:hypothetical protein
VAEDSLPGFWAEGGGGMKGADICSKDQYGFEAPTLFWYLFWRQKSTSRAVKVSFIYEIGDIGFFRL